VTLAVAAVLVGLEGLLLVVLAVLELVNLHGSRLALGLTTAAFFLALGAGLAACSRGLFRCRSWARGPTVAVQLIGVLTSFSFWGGETTQGAVLLGVVSLVALVCVVLPPSIRAMAAQDEP
jgi:hypothetical protein